MMKYRVTSSKYKSNEQPQTHQRIYLKKPSSTGSNSSATSSLLESPNSSSTASSSENKFAYLVDHDNNLLFKTPDTSEICYYLTCIISEIFFFNRTLFEYLIKFF